MTPISRIVATTRNNSDAGIKVEDVPRSVPGKHKSKEAMTTTTASASWGTEANVAQDDVKL